MKYCAGVVIVLSSLFMACTDVCVAVIDSRCHDNLTNCSDDDYLHNDKKCQGNGEIAQGDSCVCDTVNHWTGNVGS